MQWATRKPNRKKQKDIQRGYTLEGGWREYNDFFNEFWDKDKTNMSVYVGNMTIENIVKQYCTEWIIR